MLSEIVVTHVYEYGVDCTQDSTSGTTSCSSKRQHHEQLSVPECPAGTWFSAVVSMDADVGIMVRVSCDGNMQSYEGQMDVPTQLWGDLGARLLATPYAVLGWGDSEHEWGGNKPKVRFDCCLLLCKFVVLQCMPVPPSMPVCVAARQATVHRAEELRALVWLW